MVPSRRALGALTIAILLLLSLAAAPASADDDRISIPTAEPWAWPVDPPFRLDAPYVAPATPYGPGHRGIDLLPLGASDVRAPAAGVVAFAGRVAGRGIVTIDHGDGLVTTLEPVDPAVSAGEHVERGDRVAGLSIGGHAAPGRLHVGVRLDGEYVNPLLLLGGVPRAVLLPCC